MVWEVIDYKMSTENVIVSKEEKERNKQLDKRYNVNTNIIVVVVGYDKIILTFIRMEYVNDDDDSMMLLKWMLPQNVTHECVCIVYECQN